MPITLDQFRKKKPEEASIPDWVTSETTKKLYIATISKFNTIKSNISNNQSQKLEDRQLIARRIAIESGLSPSTITERRQPKIINLIKELNQELVTILKSASAKRWTSGIKLTKEELIRENKYLKAENAELRRLALESYAKAILESSISSDHRTYIFTIAKLKEEIALKDTTISNQAEQHRKYMEALSQ
jgi:Ribonuclease G/E